MSSTTPVSPPECGAVELRRLISEVSAEVQRHARSMVVLSNAMPFDSVRFEVARAEWEAAKRRANVLKVTKATGNGGGMAPPGYVPGQGRTPTERQTRTPRRYVSRSELLRRGWPSDRIPTDLGEPDRFVAGQACWLRARFLGTVEAIARCTPTTQLNDAAFMLRLAYPPWELQWLSYDAAQNEGGNQPEPRRFDAVFARMWREVVADRRWIVNYLRHRFTAYELEIAATSRLGWLDIKRRTLWLIGAEFPLLRTECVRQQRQLGR